VPRRALDACPQAAWVYEVIDKAHIFHLGHHGDKAILGLAHKRSFALRTTESKPGAPEGSSCRRIAGARACRVGERMCVQVKGAPVVDRARSVSVPQPSHRPGSPRPGDPGSIDPGRSASSTGLMTIHLLRSDSMPEHSTALPLHYLFGAIPVGND